MLMTPLSRRAVSWGVAAGLSLLLAVPAAAQTTSASVSGVVADSQGGVLAGATVTLTSRSQGSSVSTTTDKEGRFAFPIVRPDASVRGLASGVPSTTPAGW